MIGQRSTRAARGFSLLELIVAIGVIVVLTGLLVTAVNVVQDKGDRQQTENTLRLLDVALDEWQQESDRSMSFGQDGFAPDGSGAAVIYDMKHDTEHAFTTTELVRILRRSPAASKIIAQISPDLTREYDSTQADVPVWLRAGDPDDAHDPGATSALAAYGTGDWDGQIAVLDAWEHPVRAVHPGRVVIGTEVPDADGTVRLDDNMASPFEEYRVEEIYGVARNRRICFVSAGPDGRFGNVSGSATEREHAADNLYSYELVEP